MSAATPLSEFDILAELVQPDEPTMSEAHARFVLGMHFTEASQSRIRELLQKNNRGDITPQERAALDKFLRVGQFVDLLQAKARVTLAKLSVGN